MEAREETDAPALAPYRPPAPREAEAQAIDETPFPASLGRRFANSVVDNLALGGVFFAFDFLAELVGGGVQTLLDQTFVFEVMACFAVYVLPEALVGRTLGKFCTGTKVVDLQGRKPSFLQVLARTLIRFVPFDAFSFLWGDASGWHDKWSRTRVIAILDLEASV